MATEINIDMLNVGDADAIIVHLKRNQNDQLVMLIDGGRQGDAQHCLDSLKPVLTAAGKEAPDIILCTHYDADHIGGLLTIVQAFDNKIGEVWIHEHVIIKEAAELAEAILKNRRYVEKNVTPLLKFDDISLLSETADISDLTLESYPQMVKLVDYLHLKEINIVQPFAGHTFTGWESELLVLGPTVPFYNAAIPRIKHSAKGLLLEAESDAPSTKRGLLNIFEEILEETAPDPCVYLAGRPKTITLINQISIILQIMVEGNKYLFTGDASLDSFRAIPDYQTKLAKVYWLKVPHHGSERNSSPDFFNIMEPVYADISGGTSFLDDCVPNCLRQRGTKVRTTRDEKRDLLFPY
jgi:beta-lactamase superfamily II metal-dependent hydrolase